MAVTYGFYNSVGGDRVYDATQMAKIFDGIIRDGVFSTIGTAFSVVPTAGRNIEVGIGRAWFNHSWTYNDAALVIPIDAPDLVFRRIDAVVIEVDSSDPVRANDIKIVKGTPAASPSNPTLAHTATKNQYALAYVSVPVGITTFLPSHITNQIGTSNCPFVTGPLTAMTTDAMLAQWESEFVTWFDEMKGQLTTDAAGNLQIQIDTLRTANNVLLATITSTGVADQFDFNNIPAGYTNLHLVGSLKLTNDGSVYRAWPVTMRINNDSGSNYNQINEGTGAWVGLNTLFDLHNVVANHGTDSGLMTHVNFYFPSYDANNMLKVMIANIAGMNTLGNPAATFIEKRHVWRSTSPITRIRLYGTYVSTLSKLRLYGTPF